MIDNKDTHSKEFIYLTEFMLLKYTGKSKEVHIPEGTTYIARGAFSGNEMIQTLHIPSSVTGIGEMAFSECSELVTIHNSKSNIVIEREAFAHCHQLRNIKYPRNFVFSEYSRYMPNTRKIKVFYRIEAERWLKKQYESSEYHRKHTKQLKKLHQLSDIELIYIYAFCDTPFLEGQLQTMGGKTKKWLKQLISPKKATLNTPYIRDNDIEKINQTNLGSHGQYNGSSKQIKTIGISS